MDISKIKEEKTNWLAKWLFKNTEPLPQNYKRTANEMAKEIIEMLDEIEILFAERNHEANLETHD